jgi:hypothetical protein
VTIRVENTACDAAACTPLSIVGLPKDQPVLPDGPFFILLGTMRSPTACFSFPLLVTFTFQDQQGIVEHRAWHIGDSVSIGIYPESSGYSHTKQITGLFVANHAPGWHVTVPAGTNLVPDSACTSPPVPTGDVATR